MSDDVHAPPTHVVTCFLLRRTRDGDEILLVRRSQRVRTYRGSWASVSGYVEQYIAMRLEDQARRIARALDIPVNAVIGDIRGNSMVWKKFDCLRPHRHVREEELALRDEQRLRFPRRLGSGRRVKHTAVPFFS